MNKSKKIIFAIFAILIMIVIAVGNIAYSAPYTITPKSDGRVYIQFGSPYAAYNSAFKDFYCIQKGANIHSAYYNASDWHDVKDPMLAYILSLEINSAMGYDSHNSKNNEIQHLLWYYIDHKNNEDTTAMKYNNANITGGGISLKSTANYPMNGKKYSEKELWDMAAEYANRSNLEDINLTLSIEGTNVKATWTGNASSYNVYLNGSDTAYKSNITDKSLDIPITEFGQSAVAKVKIVAQQESCSAKFKVYVSGASQNILQKEASRETISKETEKEIELNTNVSLQKYIIKVNDKDLTSNETDMTDRKNTYTTADEGNDLAKKVVSKSEENNMKSANTYKKDKIVNIDAGDKVTYRIYVYNNSSIANAKSVIIKDTIPYVENNGTVTSLAVIDNIKDSTGNTITWEVDTSTDGEGKLINTNTYFYKIENLVAGQSTYFDVTLKYNTYQSGIITNTAWISTTDPKNDNTYRTVDRDYVKMKEYQISLEKFVSQVTDKDGNNAISYTNAREGKRYNDEATTDENKNTYKPKNIVDVEVGDIVTYTIRLKNTGKNNVKIHQIYDKFDANSNGVKLKYYEPYGIQGNGGGTIENNNFRGPNDSWGENNYNAYLIKFENPTLLKAGEKVDITIKYTVEVPTELTTQRQTLKNIACITGFKNQNDVEMQLPDSDKDGIDNNRDQDFVTTKTNYAVSLEKYIYKVYKYLDFDFNGDGQTDVADRTILEKFINNKEILNEEREKVLNNGDLNNDGHIDINDLTHFNKITLDKIVTYSNREGKAEHNYDDDTQTNNYWKRNNVVMVSKGDKVTYRIKLMNDGDTSVYITEVTDFFPNGVKFGDKTFSGKEYDIREVVEKNGVKFTGDVIQGNVILQPKTSKTFEVTVEVVESNMSLNILKNTATITEMKNRNEVTVIDTTLNNNTDSDYLQVNYPDFPPPDEPGSKYIPLSGRVWLDINQSKTNSNQGYDGKYDKSKEKNLEGITVKLYRTGLHQKDAPIATTKTNVSGSYFFRDEDIDPNVVTEKRQRFIKGPKVSDTEDRWTGEYYSYYIVFEYDGIKYTSTPDGKTCVSITDQKAYKDSTYKINSNAKEADEKLKESRQSFNSRFSTINKESGINYTTINENGYIPQLKYEYNKDIMNMQSATQVVTLADNDTLINQIKYINLGLRGRDIFDLELTSDVAKIDVSVNGINQTYEYANKVTVRKSDLNAKTNITEDMANTISEKSNKYVDEYNKDGQKVRNTDKPYLNSVYVTYKITVQNTSKTLGTASKVINYYDSLYHFEKAYSGDTVLNTTNAKSGKGYKSVIIDTPQTNLTQSAIMDIYVVYKLDDVSVLKSLSDSGKLATYNMAEIYEYKTFAKDSNNEYVRGLLDKDSAPGSVETEKACISDGNSNLSTLKYYFNKQELNKLKYEDDTYATPTLYFVSDSNERILTGYVFEDKTTVNSKTKIKSGNGIKDSGEKGIKGANVILYVPTSMNNKGHVKYNATSDNNGMFTISGFIPGENVDLTYWYGNNDATFCRVTNGKSYNGEDFESTNNTGLSKKENYWYIINSNKNENAISVASDVESDGTTTEVGTRKGVSTRVSKYGDKELEILNKVRAGYITETSKDSTERTIREDTKMHSKTQKFILNVEKASENGARITNGIEKYIVSNMNFGISEVPVTTLKLSSNVKELIVVDAAGDNIIASASREYNSNGTWTGKWKITGNILAPGYDSNATVDTNEMKKMLDISIEEEKLQGAKLKIKYEIIANQQIEKDFKGNSGVKATITGLVDYVDNDLSYSADSIIENNTKNSNYWEVTTYEDTQNAFKNALISRGETVSNDKKYGTTDPEGKEYTTILKANSQNPLLTLTSDSASCDLVLEKVLSAHDNSLSDIVASTIETYEYNNKIELTGLNYEGANYKVGDTTITNIDRIRTPKLEENEANYLTESWMTILPGINRYASAVSEDAAIHPPTGEIIEHNNMVWYIVATAALVVLASGVVLVKKIAVKK